VNRKNVEPRSHSFDTKISLVAERNGGVEARILEYIMDQEEINSLLATALDDANDRLTKQEEIIALLVDRLEAVTYQIDGVLNEARVAREHYATQRARLGLSFDATRGSLIGSDFGQPGL